MKDKLIDLIFPKACLGCGKPNQFLCPNCFRHLPLNPKAVLEDTWLDPLSRVAVASEYDHLLVKKVIHTYKYHFIKELAEPLGVLISRQLKRIGWASKNTILIPVPLHQRRLRWRGFNQSELLSEKISQELDLALAKQIIIRTKNTPPQVKFKRTEQRQKNLKQAFALNHQSINPKRSFFRNKTFILIDDVMTSGTTLQECAQVLKTLRPKKIKAAVIAQAQ